MVAVGPDISGSAEKNPSKTEWTLPECVNHSESFRMHALATRTGIQKSDLFAITVGS
jgi:hypothetical protein